MTGTNGGLFSVGIFHRQLSDVVRNVTPLRTVPWASAPRRWGGWSAPKIAAVNSSSAGPGADADQHQRRKVLRGFHQVGPEGFLGGQLCAQRTVQH